MNFTAKLHNNPIIVNASADGKLRSVRYLSTENFAGMDILPTLPPDKRKELRELALKHVAYSPAKQLA